MFCSSFFHCKLYKCQEFEDLGPHIGESEKNRKDHILPWLMRSLVFSPIDHICDIMGSKPSNEQFRNALQVA